MALNYHPLFEKLLTLDLSPNDYVIMGSGVMFALDIRDISELNDLDLFVSEQGWKKVKGLAENNFDENWKCHYLYLFENQIEIYNGWGPGKYDFKSIREKALIIEGFPFLSIEDTIKWKRANNREKDIKHIKMIEEYLKRIGKMVDVQGLEP